MFLNDRLQLPSERKYSDEGFLMVPARISRTGTQEYLAIEMGLTDRDPTEKIIVYRPEEEVFSDKSLQSFANKPVTDDHPAELVNAENAKEYTVGHSGPEVSKDGMFVKTTLFVIDKSAIDNIESGKVELSNGYTSDIDWSPGVTPDGEQYDAIQRNIKGNHIAIVTKGRAGSSCRVADHNPTEKETSTMKKIIDGVEFEVSDQVGQAIDKLQARLADAEKETEEKDEEMKKKEDEAKKTEDGLKAQLDDAKSKILDASALDKLITKRTELVDKAKKIYPDLKWEDKDENAIMAEVVTAKCEGVVLDSVTPDYIKARFDILVEDTSNTNLMDDELNKHITNKDSKKDDRSADVVARDSFMEKTRKQWEKK